MINTIIVVVASAAMSMSIGHLAEAGVFAQMGLTIGITFVVLTIDDIRNNIRELNQKDKP